MHFFPRSAEDESAEKHVVRNSRAHKCASNGLSLEGLATPYTTYDMLLAKCVNICGRRLARQAGRQADTVPQSHTWDAAATGRNLAVLSCVRSTIGDAPAESHLAGTNNSPKKEAEKAAGPSDSVWPLQTPSPVCPPRRPRPLRALVHALSSVVCALLRQSLQVGKREKRSPTAKATKGVRTALTAGRSEDDEDEGSGSRLLYVVTDEHQ